MRKVLILVAVLMGIGGAPALAGTAGILIADPEIFGVWASVWPDRNLSLDARLTFATADIGATAHIPFAYRSQHTFLLSALGGWAHNFVQPVHPVCDGGPRFGVGAGYGYLATWDLRILGGVSACHDGPSWVKGYELVGMFGSAF